MCAIWICLIGKKFAKSSHSTLHHHHHPKINAFVTFFIFFVCTVLTCLNIKRFNKWVWVWYLIHFCQQTRQLPTMQHHWSLGHISKVECYEFMSISAIHMQKRQNTWTSWITLYNKFACFMQSFLKTIN